MVWVNSAGNYADAHHEGTAQDADGNGKLEFSGVEMVPVDVPRGSSWVSLRWDEPRARASEDYDLLVVTEDFAKNPDASVANPAVVAVGADPQDGEDWAYERADFKSDEHRRLYAVVVKRGAKPLPATRRFSIMLRGYSSRGPTADGRTKPEATRPAPPTTTWATAWSTSIGCPSASTTRPASRSNGPR